MKNFEVVLDKTPPGDPKNHQTLCYYFEYFNDNNNKKKFIDAIINLGAYDLTTKISKVDKSSEIKIFVKKKYDIILKDWINERISYQSHVFSLDPKIVRERVLRGQSRSRNVPQMFKNEWVKHLLSIRNLGLEQDHLALIDNLISCSDLQYFNNLASNSFVQIMDQYNTKEIEIFLSYFIDSWKEKIDRSKVSKQKFRFIYNLIKALTYSSQILYISDEFKEKLKNLNLSIRHWLSTWLKGSWSIFREVQTILSIERIILGGDFAIKKIKYSEQIINKVIENPEVFLFGTPHYLMQSKRIGIAYLKPQLEFLNFLRKLGYKFSKEKSNIFLDIIIKYLNIIKQQSLPNQSTNETSSLGLKIKMVKYANQYFELFLLFFLTLSRSKQFQKLNNFIIVIDQLRELYSRQMLYFKDLDEFNVLSGKIKKENSSGFFIEFDKITLNRNKNFIEKELQKIVQKIKFRRGGKYPSEEKIKKLEGNLKNGFIRKKIFRRAVSIDEEIYQFFISEISNFGNRVRLFDAGRIHRSESSVKELVNKYDLKGFCPLLEIFLLNISLNLLNLKPDDKESWNTYNKDIDKDMSRIMWVLTQIDYSYNPESLKIIFDDFAEIKSKNPDLKTVIQKRRPETFKKLSQQINEKIKYEKDWEKIVQLYLNKESLSGLINEISRGRSGKPNGFLVKILGLKSFNKHIAYLPSSQIDGKRPDDFDKYVNKTMDFRIVKINNVLKNVVVSHKAYTDAKIISQFEKGQVLEGIVKNITNYGVFVDLGVVDGLIHITDLSWNRINHPSDIVELNQKLNVVILDFDGDKSEIQLGIKQLIEHPWENLDSKLKEGDIVNGKISLLADYGAFIEIAEGVEGLVHVSEMSWSTQIYSTQGLVNVGDEVEAVILSIDREEKKLLLSFKALVSDPWTDITKKYPKKSKHKGKIKNFTNFGVFVELEEGIDGLVHKNDIDALIEENERGKKIKNKLSELFQINDEIDIIIDDIEIEERKVSLRISN